jgi:hypothetical protein
LVNTGVMVVASGVFVVAAGDGVTVGVTPGLAVTTGVAVDRAVGVARAGADRSWGRAG